MKRKISILVLLGVIELWPDTRLPACSPGNCYERCDVACGAAGLPLYDAECCDGPEGVQCYCNCTGEDPNTCPTP